MLAWSVRLVVLWIGLVAAALYLWEQRDGLIAGAAPASARTAEASRGRPAGASVPNELTLRADRLGHFVVDGTVNGAPTRFLVDSGASYVSLSLDQAAAAGIGRSSLRFTQKVQTANGVVMVAPVTLREVRIGQLVMTEVPAAVHDGPIGNALLGMSFLKRLDGYEVRNGELRLRW
jgi:aspartyl protease family protein